MHFSYIGALAGEDFSWDAASGASSGKLPPRLVPREKTRDIGVAPDWIWQRIREGNDGKQLDWGAWGVKMTGAELRATLGAAGLEALSDDETYVLVAGEIY